MDHWIMLPLVLPALVAPLVIVFLRRRLAAARAVTLLTLLAVVASAVHLVVLSAQGGPQSYLLGDWPAPFGIVLVLDRLSAVMVLLASLLTLGATLYASAGWDAKGRHFHALILFQLFGLNGAFLTGDVFNLFVFFEVLLIASYGLILHGGGAERLRSGLQYVVINLAGSTLFLVAVGLIYGITGTLNMADLADKVPGAAPGDRALLNAGLLMLIGVFALKAAVAPLHLWLPRAYAAAPAPAAALFAIMTKVGAYSILRVTTVAMGEDAGAAAWLPQDWLWPAALVSLGLGMFGVLAAKTLGRLAAYAVLASTGTLVATLAVFTPESAAAAMFYLVHSTLAGAALFLLADLIGRRRAGVGDRLNTAPRFSDAGLLGVLFFLAAVAFAGLPPLSGFVGKLMILQAVADQPQGPWIWAMVLGTTLIAVVALARAGSVLFWKSASVEGTLAPEPDAPRAVLPVAAAAALVGATVALSLFAGPTTDFMRGAAAQLFEPRAYVDAVLRGSPVSAERAETTAATASEASR